MFFVNLLFLLCAGVSVIRAQDSAPELLSVEKCPVLNGKEVNFDINFTNKGVSLKLKLEQPINARTTFMAPSEIDNGHGNYVPYVKADGNLCDILNNTAKRAMDKLRKEIKPSFKDCQMDPGDYELTDFKLNKEDVSFHNFPEGPFKVPFHVFDGSGTELACILVNVRFDEEE